MCRLKTISRVSGKPNVISINGVEREFSSSEALQEAWGKLKLQGYSVPENNCSNLLEIWG